jgi:hypothetical protein
MANKAQFYQPAAPGEVRPPWESIWHSGLDYVSPELDPNHPMLSGEAGFVRPQVQQPEQ